MRQKNIKNYAKEKEIKQKMERSLFEGNGVIKNYQLPLERGRKSISVTQCLFLTEDHG